MVNKSTQATPEDKMDIRIGESLVSRQKQYRVASPFLQFLSQLRKCWIQDTGRPLSELVSQLAERPDLAWVDDPKLRTEWVALLRLLDAHVTALIEESGTNAEDWLQNRTKDIVDLLVGATTILPGELEFIREAVLARATFICKMTPQQQRQQDYLLGLPLADCGAIRANQEALLSWYQGCTDIFARKLDTGVDMLVKVLNFVSTLSICPKKWRCRPSETLPLFGDTMPDAKTASRSALFKSWVLGEDIQTVTFKFGQWKADADFDQYREEMFERNLAWGVSALCRFLKDQAQEKGLRLTEDLEFLPSLVKYGVSGKLACYLVGLKIPREVAVHVAELYGHRMRSMDDYPADLAQPGLAVAEEAIRSLTKDDIAFLHLDEATARLVEEIRAGS